MVRYHVKQHIKLGGEAFTIKDDKGKVAYRVKGSFLSLPKTFEIFDAHNQLVSRLVKPVLTILPRFQVVLTSGQSFTLQKQWSLWKDRYRLDNLGLTVEGDIWDMSFRLKNNQGQIVAKITKQLFHLTSSYTVEVLLESYSDLVISLVVAIDYVEMLENSSH